MKNRPSGHEDSYFDPPTQQQKWERFRKATRATTKYVYGSADQSEKKIHKEPTSCEKRNLMRIDVILLKKAVSIVDTPPAISDQ